MNDPMNENDNILAGALGRLPREMAPPGALEEATVASLRSAGLLKAKAPARAQSGLNLATWVLAASIGAIAFVGGSVYQSTRPQPSQPMFELTVYGASSNDDSATKVNRANAIEQWALSANALPERTGSVSVRTAAEYGDSIIVEEEPSMPAEIVRKYYVEAPTQDSAVKIAKNCPSLKYGGRVIVQALDKKP